MKKILLFTIVLLFTLSVNAQTFTKDNITYEVTSSTAVKTTGYNTAGGTVVNIPATVTDNTITYNVTEIGVQSFFSTSLTSVTIPDSVEIIGASAFSNNNNLSSATIGEGVTLIGVSAFFGADLSSVIIPDSVVSIEKQAFDLNSLTSVTFGTSLTSIGNKAFLNNNLTSIALPQSLIIIKGEAFKGNQLTSITIPENVTTIEPFAFGGNPLATVTSLSQTPPVITNQVFGGRANIDLIIPTGTATAYSGVIASKWGGFKTVSDSSFLTFTINKIVYEVTSTTNNTAKTVDFLVPSNSTNNAVNIPATVTANSITYTVTEIENYSFLGGGSQPNLISDLVIPNGITRIGYQAFRFNGISSLIIPDSVETIGAGAFWLNTNLSNVTLGSSVATIGDEAFQSCNISTIVFPSNLTTIGFLAFKNNQLSNVTIPNNVTSIGYEAFSGNPLTDVTSMATTPPTIFTGSLDTFSSDRSSINLHIPQGTTGDYVTNSGALWTGFNTVTEDVALAVGDTFITNFITYEITSTTSNKVKVIDYDTAGGTMVNIPAATANNYNVTKIGQDAFRDKSLTDVVIPIGVTSIDKDAFRGNNLTDVIIPDGVTFINTNTFRGNNLTSVTIPNSVTFISINAFFGNNLTNVTLPVGLTTIGTGAFRDNSLTSIVIPNNVTTIGSGAFSGNNLTSVVIPNGVTSISGFTFRNNSLTSVTLPDGLTLIGSTAFDGNNLTGITLPDGLTSIENSAFSNNNLTNITIPSNVTSIGSYAFFNNPLTNVTSLATVPPSIITDGVNGSSDTFANDRSNIDLTIPTSAVGAYVTDTGALWKGFKTVNGATLSVSNFELSNAIKIASTKNAIKIISDNSVKLQNYTVYTISGVEVAKGNKNTIPTNYLSKGIYILKLDFDKGIFTKKVLID